MRCLRLTPLPVLVTLIRSMMRSITLSRSEACSISAVRSGSKICALSGGTMNTALVASLLDNPLNCLSVFG